MRNASFYSQTAGSSHVREVQFREEKIVRFFHHSMNVSLRCLDATSANANKPPLMPARPCRDQNTNNTGATKGLGWMGPQELG